MGLYLSQRVFQSAVVLLIMSFVVYSLIGLMPGDPIDIMLAANPEAGPEDAARLRAIYGLDRPLYIRYFSWLDAVLHGDFGYSRLFNQPVLDILMPRLWSTVTLMSVSISFAVIIALPLGIKAAQKPHGLADNFINLFCFAGISIPQFWLALLFITLFAVTLGWLPASGTGNTGNVSTSIQLSHLILPVLTLTTASIANYTRHIRSAMIEALQGEHIRTARAKGCSEFRVVWLHALQNALLPFITIIALDFGTLFGGALITETMFAWPGMGKMIYDAIMGNDFNLALIGLLFVTLMILIGNFCADLAYSFLDPRISLKDKLDG